MASSRRMLSPSHREERRGDRQGDRQGDKTRGLEGLLFIPSIRLITWPQHVGLQTVITLKALLSRPHSTSLLPLSCLTQSRIRRPAPSHLSSLVIPLFSLPPLRCHSFSLIHYPSTKYLLWQGHTVADFSLFTSTPNKKQCSTRSPHRAQLTHTHIHTHLGPYMHQQPCNILAREPRPNTGPSVSVCVFPLISQRFEEAGLRCGWEPQRYVIQSLRVYVFNLVAAVGQSVT